MNIGFYNPYYDSFGGGERYTLTLASHWSKAHDVSVFWDGQNMLHQAEKRFNLDFSKISTVPNVFHTGNILEKLSVTSKYDLIFFLSDGSIPLSLARHTILHFQMPYPRIPFPWFKKMKTSAIVCNSEFTKAHIDPTVGKIAKVIYPPVATHEFKTGTKEKIILSVGRFDSCYHAKKQDVLIDTFKEGIKNVFYKGWKLVLAGSMLPTDKAYVNSLKKLAQGLPIEFAVDIPFDELRTLYAKAMIYWHAAGYKETDPTLLEHFGISTVEAMASGCIPIAYNGGGQPEIIDQGKNGYLWNTKEECLKFTKEAVRSVKIQKIVREAAIERSKAFSLDIFCRKFDALLQDF